MLTLLRVSTDEDVGTYGVLKWDDAAAPFALSLENPWLDNAVNVSCIPHGVYKCAPVQSPKFGHTFEVLDVPDRTHILFHKGNTHVDTHGCILVGEQFTFLDGVPGVGASRAGFDEFYKTAAGLGEFELRVAWAL